MTITIFTHRGVDVSYPGVMALFLEIGLELLLWIVDLLSSNIGAVVWKFRELFAPHNQIAGIGDRYSVPQRQLQTNRHVEVGCSLCPRFPQINQRKKELGRGRVGGHFAESGVEK